MSVTVSHLIRVFLVEERLIKVIKVRFGVAIAFGRNPLDFCLTVVLVETWKIMALFIVYFIGNNVRISRKEARNRNHTDEQFFWTSVKLSYILVLHDVVTTKSALRMVTSLLPTGVAFHTQKICTNSGSILILQFVTTTDRVNLNNTHPMSRHWSCLWLVVWLWSPEV